MPKTIRNIYKRKDGRWEARYPIGKTQTGKTKYASIYAKNYNEAKALLLKAQTSQFTTFNKKKLFSDVLNEWMTINAMKQKAATKLKYDYLIKTHITPELGGYNVANITEKIINEFLNKKIANGRLDKSGGLSWNYVKTMLIIIESALDYAKEQNWCSGLNKKIVKPIMEQKSISILNPSELKKLEEGLINDTSLESLGIMISLYTGLRIGEICALHWNDVDLENRIIHIRHTVARIKNPDIHAQSKTCLIIESPKTLSSMRDIPITTNLFELLSIAQSSSRSEFVISDHSSFLSPRTYEYRFHKKLDALNITQINYHTLRHTFATRCIEKGVDIKSLSEILGHSNVSITLNTYVHSSMELKRAQLEKII